MSNTRIHTTSNLAYLVDLSDAEFENFVKRMSEEDPVSLLAFEQSFQTVYLVRSQIVGFERAAKGTGFDRP